MRRRASVTYLAYNVGEIALDALPGRSACLLRTKCAAAAAALGLSVPRANVAALLTE